MTIFEFVFRKLAARRRRRQLRAIREWIATLEDQVASGQEMLRRYRGKAERIEAQLMLDVAPDDIVRRSGAGA